MDLSLSYPANDYPGESMFGKMYKKEGGEWRKEWWFRAHINLDILLIR